MISNFLHYNRRHSIHKVDIRDLSACAVAWGLWHWWPPGSNRYSKTACAYTSSPPRPLAILASFYCIELWKRNGLTQYALPCIFSSWLKWKVNVLDTGHQLWLWLSQMFKWFSRCSCVEMFECLGLRKGTSRGAGERGCRARSLQLVFVVRFLKFPFIFSYL